MVSKATDKRKIVAILAADVVGYSRLMGISEYETIRRLRGFHEEIFKPEIKTWRGRIFKEMGDCFLAEFTSIVDAVHCAVGLQKRVSLDNQGVSEDTQIL